MVVTADRMVNKWRRNIFGQSKAYQGIKGECEDIASPRESLDNFKSI